MILAWLVQIDDRDEGCLKRFYFPDGLGWWPLIWFEPSTFNHRGKPQKNNKIMLEKIYENIKIPTDGAN